MIGLSLALELRRRGRTVTVMEKRAAGAGASRAAAGMLAAHDPGNPAELQALSELSLELYPEFLERVGSLAGVAVPLETEWTLEQAEDGEDARGLLRTLSAESGRFRLIREQSLNPRKLAEALLTAARAAGVTVLENTAFEAGASENFVGRTLESFQQGTNDSFEQGKDQNEEAEHTQWVDCTGAWCAWFCRPAKGQMLRVQMPEGAMAMQGSGGNVVVRNHAIYLVPRLDGSVVIGATVENAGFNTDVEEEAIADLRARGARLIPLIADAPEVERWAGLRPSTADGLPVLGQVGRRRFVATGHFRNGILLAPATARVMAQMLHGEETPVDLGPFSPMRMSLEEADGVR